MDDVTETPATIEDLIGDRHLVALTPADMAPAQQFLSAWRDRKIGELEDERTDHETNLELATEHGWKHQSVTRVLDRLAKRISYYQKIKAAVDAGYVIVPNFPVQLFAVRVRRMKQREKTTDHEWGSAFNASAQMLPIGEGRYVDDQVLHRDESFSETVDGKQKQVRRYITDAYNDVDFPLALVKPTITAATARAMALKIFDQLGIVQNIAGSGRDPIVVGQLLDPRGNRRVVSFFVAWWINTADL